MLRGLVRAVHQGSSTLRGHAAKELDANMKTTSLLALPFALVLASMVASTVACSQPTLQPYDSGEEDEDEDEGSSATTKKPSKKSSSTSNNDNSSSAPAPSGTVPPPPSGTTPPPPPPAPGGDPLACMDQCVAAGPAAQYWQCSESCQDMQCDDNCWFGSACGQQEQACIQSLESCDQQCGFSASQGGGDPNDPFGGF